MTLERVHGNVWDHSREVIPEDLQPRLWAVPLGDRVAGSLLVGTKRRAALNSATGRFHVDVEGGLDYVMEMDWLFPGQAHSDTGDYARNYAQWAPFNAGAGGDIASLAPPTATGYLVVALGPPPPGTTVPWVDLTNVTPSGVLVYAQGGS